MLIFSLKYFYFFLNFHLKYFHNWHIINLTDKFYFLQLAGYWKQPYSEHEENLDSLSCSEERKTNEMFSYSYSVDKETEGNFDNNSSHLQFTLLDAER